MLFLRLHGCFWNEINFQERTPGPELVEANDDFHPLLREVEWFDFLLMFHGHNLQVARVFTLSFDGIGSIFITLIRFRGFEYRDLIYYLSENVFTSVYEYNANPDWYFRFFFITAWICLAAILRFDSWLIIWLWARFWCTYLIRIEYFTLDLISKWEFPSIKFVGVYEDRYPTLQKAAWFRFLMATMHRCTMGDLDQ